MLLTLFVGCATTAPVTEPTKTWTVNGSSVDVPVSWKVAQDSSGVVGAQQTLTRCSAATVSMVELGPDVTDTVDRDEEEGMRCVTHRYVRHLGRTRLTCTASHEDDGFPSAGVCSSILASFRTSIVPEKHPPTARFRGRLTVRETGAEFVRCGAKAVVPVEQLSSTLHAQIAMMSPGDAPTVWALLEGTMKNERLNIGRWHRLDLNDDCDDPLPTGSWAMHGTEPFWAISIDGQEARWTLRSPEEDGKRIVSADGSAPGGQPRFQLRADGQEELVVDVKPETCNDGMADVYYPYTVTVSRSNGRFMGCAFQP